MTRIGILDSGVGGLAVLDLVREQLPACDLLYVADHAFAPYGPRQASELVERVSQIARWLMAEGAELVVLACNTATVTSIQALRERFPGRPFVGMEPAIKPAAQAADRIVVLGTQCTVTNERYRQLCREQAHDKQVWHVAAPELVQQVESGRLDDPANLHRLLGEAVAAGAQAVVIGCTHFSFLVPIIQREWPQLAIFDGRYGTLNRIKALLGANGGAAGTATAALFTTGPAMTLQLGGSEVRFEHIALP